MCVCVCVCDVGCLVGGLRTDGWMVEGRLEEGRVDEDLLNGAPRQPQPPPAPRGAAAQVLSAEEAHDCRDALAKAIYASIFDWVVAQINAKLDTGALGWARA